MKPGLLSLLLLSVATAHAGESDLRRCRGIADAALRLACYDALPVAPATTAAPAAAAVAAPSAAPVVPAAAGEAAFGLARRADELQEITSYIPGRFEGWSRNGRIRLANGQVWQVTDDSMAFYNHLRDPKVTVRRAAMGSFMLDIEGSPNTPRVRRVE